MERIRLRLALFFGAKKQFFGGSRPLMPANGTAAYSLFIWFFARFGPDRQVARGLYLH
jgi:hypothetical protein